MMAFQQALSLCIRQNPNHPLVLFMEGRMHLALMMLTDEQKAMLEINSTNLQVPVADPAAAESKLRRSIQLDPTCIDGYITLAYVLVKAHKLSEAKQVAEKGLVVQRFTKSDEEIGRELEDLLQNLGNALR